MKINLIENSTNDFTKILKTVLQNRGILSPIDYMRCNTEDIEQNHYSDLDNIDEGVDCLLQHIENEDNIALIVDPDVDGITSSAILVNYLKELSDNGDIKPVNWNFVSHSGKGHGISPDVVIPDNIKLIITPDGGSNDFEQHKFYKDKGIDVLVIDHHEPEKISEDAIIINNQSSKNYSNKDFSGVGVVFRFLQALDDRFFSTFSDNYLDLVAIGNVADVMNTISFETRYFIQQGILTKNLKNPFLKILVKKTGVDVGSDLERYIYPIDVSFKIAPLINALLRLGTLEEKEMLFQCFISPEEELSTRKGICKKTIDTMTNYKEKQDNEKAALIENIKKDCINSDIETNDPVLVLDVTGIVDNAEIMGLAAMNLASIYNRPVILGNEKQDGKISGSVRVNNGFPDSHFKDVCEDSGLFNFAAGHQSSFGFAYWKNNLEKIKEYFRNKYDLESMENVHTVDFIIDNINNLNKSDFFLIQSYKYLWGRGLEEPLFGLLNIPLDTYNLSILGKKNDTVKYTYNGIEFMFFRCDENSVILKFAKGEIAGNYDLTVVGKLGISNFAGRSKNQVIVDDYEINEVEDPLSDFSF